MEPRPTSGLRNKTPEATMSTEPTQSPSVEIPASSELLWFTWACRSYACVPLGVGSIVALSGGAGLDLVFGTELGELGPNLESHVRFLASVFTAMGLILFWGTADALARRVALRIGFGSMVVGGAMRLVALALYGAPSTMTMLIIGGELMAGPLLLWHARILRQLRRST